MQSQAGSYYSRKIQLLNLSVQLAFWSRNLVCSSDFLIAEQFCSWMDTDCLLQQSFDHFKEQLFFCFEGWVFLILVGPRLTTFLLLKEATHSKNIQTFGQVLGANFGTNFGDTFLSCFLSRSQNWAPKMGFKIGPQNLKVGALPLHPARAEWLPTQDPIKLEKPTPQSRIYWLFEMVGSLLEQIVSLHPIENCSAMGKSESNEHTKFLLQNADWTLKFKSWIFLL